MRVSNFWTIGNQHDVKVFYGLYGLADTTYAAALDGRQGWIESGKAIDLEVDANKYQIVFWKAQPVFGAGEKLAAPKEVRTDRSVTFTKHKVVVQPDKPEFSDPKHVGPVVFMTAMDFNNTVRSIVLAAMGKIPEVGGAIAALLGFLWSEEKEDLIAASEERMKRWVQGRFEEYDRQFLQAKLSGLRKLLDEYTNATGRQERARWFDASLGACEQTLPFFTERDFTPGTSALAIALGTIHLTLLRERVVHPDDLFEDNEVNMAFFRKTLKETLKTYQDYILKVSVPGELKARHALIVETNFGGKNRDAGPIFLRDWVTREVHGFRYDSSPRDSSAQNQRVCVDYYLEQAEGSLERQLQENVVHTAMLWTLLDPDRQEERPLPLDGVTWNAALAGLGYMFGNAHHHEHNDAARVKVGRITEITVLQDVGIVGLEFKGETGHTAQHLHDKGTRHVVKVPAGAFLTKVETWFDYDLFGIRFHFSDGTSQGPFGTPKRGSVHQTAEFPLHHVTAIGIGKRLQELRCGFTPLPDYYERLAQR